MAEQLRILVCGDVEGNFKKLYSRVNSIIKKSGTFDYLFCVGNFFGETDEEFLLFKNGLAKASVPTFILGPNDVDSLKFYPDVNGCDLAPNITYLGKRGVFSTSAGLMIAYVSGVEDPKIDAACRLTEDDLVRVRNACLRNRSSPYHGIDILLTSSWPANITKFVESSLSNPPAGSLTISKLSNDIKPRYHFFGLQKRFYERRPFKNTATEFGCHFTRAIGLANVANDKKEKWLYAMNITPFKFMKTSELNMMTTDTTECPYTFQEECKSQQFFYDMNYKDTERKPKRKHQNNDGDRQYRKVMNVSQDECWFCLASPKFEKHLVVSIGEESYLTLAKGGLVWDHVMILPISHYKNFSDMAPSLREEIQQSLVKYYASQKKVPVFFDRNFKTPHYQMQVIPIPSNYIERVKQTFMSMAEQKNFSLTEIPSSAELEDILRADSSYFYLEIGKYRLIHTIDRYFPLQFAREVLVCEELLNLPGRKEWKDCEIPKEEESKNAERFRNNFKPFDPIM